MTEDWTIEIRPRKKWFNLNLRALWRYRDLYRMYVRRDIVTEYKQTILGPLWYLIQPVFTTIMYMFVFGGLAGISTDGAPQPLFYFSGVMLWNYFNACFLRCSDVFITNLPVFGKVYFPRLIVPLASITSNLFKMMIQFGLFVTIYIGYLIVGMSCSLNWAVLLFPLLVLLLAFHALSMGLIVSSFATKYHDLKITITFGMQLFMFATPIIYPLSVASENYRFLMQLNPLTSIFEAFKYGWLGCGSLSWGWLLYSTLFMLTMLFFSIIIFTRVERNFVDNA